jgi:hypothetical protein
LLFQALAVPENAAQSKKMIKKYAIFFMLSLIQRADRCHPRTLQYVNVRENG